MSKATYPLKVPASMTVAQLARKDAMSPNQWIASAVAQRIGVVETAAEFFRRRASGRTGDGMGGILDKLPDRAPEPGDELPAGWDPNTFR